LDTAGLTQAFSEIAEPDCGKAAFQKKKKAGPGLGDQQGSGSLTLTLIRRKPFLRIKVRVGALDGG